MCIYIYIYVYMCVYTHMCIYIYIYIHIYTHTGPPIRTKTTPRSQTSKALRSIRKLIISESEFIRGPGNSTPWNSEPA